MASSSEQDELRALWYQKGYYSERTVADHMRDGATRFPHTTLHFTGGAAPGSIPLDEMYGRSLRLAGGLAKLGVGHGDVIAIWVPNWVEGALTVCASMLLGATVVPIIHIYGPQEVGFILRQSGARVLVMPDRWRKIDYLERFDAITDIPDLEEVVYIGEHGPSGAIPWQDLAESAAPGLLPTTHPDERCLLTYTSGTTADPKGVQHSTNTLVAEVLTTAAVNGQDQRTLNLFAFPAGHFTGIVQLLRSYVIGQSAVIMDAWHPELGARLIAEHRLDTAGGAAFHLATLMDAAERNGDDLSSLTSYAVGAATVPPNLVERANRAEISAYRLYGSSEHPIVTTASPTDPLSKRTHTDGRLTPGSEIRLLDDNDREVDVGEDGEVVSRGPDLFMGYTDERLNAESFLPGGWFRTGDIGRFDTDGYLTITDRKKDMIIRGGENIAPKEVEDLLALHPAIAEAAVVGQPDDRYGERVAAFIQLHPGQEVDLEGVRRHFASMGVAKQKTPEQIEVIDELPRTPSGKVRKVDLRQRLRGH